jgi:hypothetical protein
VWKSVPACAGFIPQADLRTPSPLSGAGNYLPGMLPLLFPQIGLLSLVLPRLGKGLLRCWSRPSEERSRYMTSVRRSPTAPTGDHIALGKSAEWKNKQ